MPLEARIEGFLSAEERGWAVCQTTLSADRYAPGHLQVASLVGGDIGDRTGTHVALDTPVRGSGIEARSFAICCRSIASANCS